MPLTWQTFSEGLSADLLELVVPLDARHSSAELPTLQSGDFALQAESKDAARSAREASSLLSMIGWTDGTVIIELSQRKELALFDVGARMVVSRTSYAQINDHMGDESDDDYVTDVSSKLIMNLDAKIGIVVNRGFRSFELGTSTSLVGATIACGGTCLNANGWSFDLMRAIALGVGITGDAEAWKRDQEASLARTMPSGEDGYVGMPEEITRHPILSRAQKMLELWYEKIGSGFITHDLDGSTPQYVVATAGDGSWSRLRRMAASG